MVRSGSQLIILTCCHMRLRLRQLPPAMPLPLPQTGALESPLLPRSTTLFRFTLDVSTNC